MKNWIKNIGISSLLFFACASFNCSGQVGSVKEILVLENNDFNKNVVRGSLGFALIYVQASVQYERMLFGRHNKSLQSVWLSAGGGRYFVYTDWGTQFNLKSFALFGKNAAHFELGVGAAVIKTESMDQFKLLPAGNLGYRFQKSDGHFMFRTGVGLPEGLYIGFGFVF
jgi:hypothetical protein